MTLNGEPVSNSPVSLWSNGRRVASATTDPQGRFTLTVRPGTDDGVEACAALSPVPEAITVARNQIKHDITCQAP